MRIFVYTTKSDLDIYMVVAESRERADELMLENCSEEERGVPAEYDPTEEGSHYVGL